MARQRVFSQAKGMCAGVALALLLAPIAAPQTARADDAAPLDNSQWISFDHYNEAVAHGQNPLPDRQPDNPHIDAATLAPDAAAQKDGAIPASASAAPSATPAAAGESGSAGAPHIAPPTRAIVPPVMPGMNREFDIKVTTTEDEKPPAAQITNIETKPDMHLPSSNWQDAAAAAKDSGNIDQDESQAPLNIRYSMLPGAKLTPVPSPAQDSYRDRTLALSKQPAPKPEVKTDPASCSPAAGSAAVDAYKKHQLEALESDRKTLAALQAAIKQMGLQKELSFMTGARGSINQADNQAAAGSEVKIDLPAPAPSPAKN